jgi:hypothetical protein
VFIKRKKAIGSKEFLAAIAEAEEKESMRELAEVLDQYTAIVDELADKLYSASMEAFKEAAREVGVPEHALPPSLVRPYITILSDNPLHVLASAVKRGVADEEYIHSNLLTLLDEASYDQGGLNKMEKLVLLADPRVAKKYKPYLKTALTDPSHIIGTVKNVVEIAIRKCRKLLGKDGYVSCVTTELKSHLPALQNEARKVDVEELKKELKELYKAVLKHGKEFGLGEEIYW